MDNKYQQMAKNLLNSQFYLALVTNNFLKDSRCATEIGLAVLLDKPIVLMVKKGTVLPENLKKVAKTIEYFDNKEDIEPATKRIMASLTKNCG